MYYESERKQLLEIIRTIVQKELVMSTWGNVSVRGGSEHFLITPSARDYMSMQPEDLVLLDLQENIIEGKWKPSSEMALHAGVYRTRPEVGAVLHVHSLYTSMFAVAHGAIPVILEETAQVIGHKVMTLAYAPCGTAELAAMVSHEAMEKRAVLLANHGLIAFGEDLEDALRIALIAEKTAQVAIGAEVLGNVYSLAPEEIDRLRSGYLQYLRAGKD